MREREGLFEAMVGARVAAWDGGGRLLGRARGSDRVRFLNGMVSNDVAALAAGRSRRATLLSRKGRILSDLFVLADDDALLLDFAPGTGRSALEILEKHVIADDVELDVPEQCEARLVLEGPEAAAAAARAGAPALEPGAHARAGDLHWWRGGGLSSSAHTALGSAAAVARLAEEAALPALDPDARRVLSVALFRPEYGRDMSDANFPAEARLDDAISHTKGCYIGQEIVARIHSRGAVNKLLVQLRSELLAEPDDAVTKDGREVGRVTSAAHSPLDGPLALAYVKAELAAPGSALELRERPALVVGPPFDAA